MKKVLLNVVLISCIATVSVAQIGVQIPASFRYQATGGTIEDDLDLVLSPIDIPKVEGYRLYTSLSNLVNYEEEMLNNLSANEFLVALSGNLIQLVPDLRTAILVQHWKETTLGWNGIDLNGDGFNDMWGWGLISGDWTEWEDLNNDDQYDVKKRRQASKDDEYIEKKHTYILNNNYDLGGGMTFGLRIAQQNLVGEDNNANNDFDWSGLGINFPFSIVWSGDPTFTNHYTETDIPNNTTIRKQDETGEFSTTVSEPTLSIHGGVTYEMGDKEYAGIVGLTFNKDKTETEDKFSSAYAIDPSTNQNYFSGNQTIKYTGEESVTELSLAGRARWNLWPKEKGFIEGAAGVMFGMGGSVTDKTEDNLSITQRLLNPLGNIDTETWDNDFLTDGSGDISTRTYGFGGRANVPLSKPVFLGLGAYFSSYNYERTVTLTTNNIDSYTFDDGDTEPSDPDDYTDRATTVGKDEEIYEEKTTSIGFPVGLEYTFGKKKNWVFRIGAVPTFNWSSDVTTSNVIEPEVTTNVTTYGDGTADTTVTVEEEYQSTKVSEFERWTDTDYIYGLGWYPTDNLQIDFLYFFDGSGAFAEDIFDLSFFRSLRFSITLKYY